MDVCTVTCSQSCREARQLSDSARESVEPRAAPSQNPTISSAVAKTSSSHFDPACETHCVTHNANFSCSWAADHFYECKMQKLMFMNMKVLRDLLGSVPRVLSRVFCFPLFSLSFSVTLLPLIFVNPLDLLSLWEILWMVGIADFIPKFPFMGFKCLLLLMSPFIMLFKSKDRFCEYFLHNKVLELLLAKDSIQMWKLFVHCVKENLKNLF
ncbi:hypothetical protein Celaphus_00005325, partial [Cervus elaphus hippelaphus]